MEELPILKVVILRARWASSDARSAAQTVKGLAFSSLAGAALGFLASQGSEDPSVLVVLAAALLGVLAPLLAVFCWSFLTIPRRHLEWRADQLEEQLQGLQAQMNQFMEEKYGDPLQFLPIYHELRTDIREALRILGRAKETGELWPRTSGPEYGKWKRHKDHIATSPWARIDGLHGELLEAFDHVERLASGTAIRFGGRRRVRATDDLDAAIGALEIAEDRLNFSINRLERIQTPDELWAADDA